MKKIALLFLIGIISMAMLIGCAEEVTEEIVEEEAEEVEEVEEAEEIAFPERNIVLVSHGSEGGGMDTYLRYLGRSMEEFLDVQVIIENRTGGASAVATSYVANSAPDGHVLMGITNTHINTPISEDTENDIHDLAAVSRMLVDPQVLITNAEREWDSLEDVLEHAEENPGEQTWGVAQVGSEAYMIMTILRDEYGYDIEPVPYEGGGEMITEVAGDHIDVGIGDGSEISSQIDAGNIKALASFTEDRLDGMPEVQTAKDAGYDIVVDKIRGIMAPKDTPPEVVSFLDDLFYKIVNECELFEEYYLEASMEPAYQNADEFMEYLRQVESNTKDYYRDIGLID